MNLMRSFIQRLIGMKLEYFLYMKGKESNQTFVTTCKTEMYFSLLKK